MKGWFAMSRAMFEHPIFAGKPERVAAWAWILARAAWKDTKQNANGKIVTIKRGQLLTSYRQMSEATGVGVMVLRGLIDQLRTQHAINTDTNTGRLLITICNYDKYQSAMKTDNTAPNKPVTHGQHTKETREQDNNSFLTEGTASQPVSEPLKVSIVTSALWSAGVHYLTSQGIAEKQARSVIGRWRKEADDLAIFSAIEAAQKAGTEDPIPYITEALKGHDHAKPSKQDERFQAFIAGARSTS